MAGALSGSVENRRVELMEYARPLLAELEDFDAGIDDAFKRLVRLMEPLEGSDLSLRGSFRDLEQARESYHTAASNAIYVLERLLRYSEERLLAATGAV
jgi:hypothetical protein